MRRTLILAVPLILLVPIAYAAAYLSFGRQFELPALLAGAAGWFVALLLRMPVGLVGMKVSGDAKRTQTWVIASSGPLEETVRLAVLLLLSRDLSTALWIGLGWAAIEVLYAIGNGFALAALAERTDEEAERAKAMLPPSVLSASGPLWGVVERAWASAVHIGFTLILAAVPLAIVITAPLHTLTNIGFLRLIRSQGVAAVSGAGVIFGAVLLAVGLWLHAA